MKTRYDREQTGAVAPASPRVPALGRRIAQLTGIVLLAVTMLGGFATSASARVNVFLGFDAPVYYDPYPRMYYHDQYAYSPYYDYSYRTYQRSVWIPGHWERRHDGWGRRVRVWVPGHYRY